MTGAAFGTIENLTDSLFAHILGVSGKKEEEVRYHSSYLPAGRQAGRQAHKRSEDFDALCLHYLASWLVGIWFLTTTIYCL